MKLRLTPSSDHHSLHFAGELDVYTVECARAALLEHFVDAAPLALDLREVTACDSAGLQLLIAARRSALAAGKPFSLTQPVPLLVAAAELLGLSPDSWLDPAP